MSTLEVIAAVVDALAWPISTLAILVLFRQSLRALLPTVNRFKYKDIEVEFGKELAEVRKQLRPPPENKRLEAGDDEADYYRAVGEASPRTAIIEAWIGMETTAVSSARALDLLPANRHAPFPKWVSALRKAELLTDQEANGLSRLRDLRNSAAHEWRLRIGHHEVDEFIQVSRDIAESIAVRTWERMPKGC